jgi:hypothetical protein
MPGEYAVLLWHRVDGGKKGCCGYACCRSIVVGCGAYALYDVSTKAPENYDPVERMPEPLSRLGLDHSAICERAAYQALTRSLARVRLRARYLRQHQARSRHSGCQLHQEFPP